MKVHELFSELASEKRLGILQALGEKSMKFTKLSGKFDMTSPEASRQLSRLMEASLIEKKGDGDYHISHLGKLVLSRLSDLQFISEKSEYFIKHDTTPIPQHLLSQIDVLSTGVIVTGVYEILRTMDKFVRDVNEYNWYMADDFPRHFTPIIQEKGDEGVDIKTILPEDLIISVLPTVSEKIRENVETKMLDEVNISIIASDAIAFLGLPGPDGKIDHNVVIFGQDPRFKNWCKELFEYYWEKARPCEI